MKCIYCNNSGDLTISDIIPYALTGAKIKKRFVCQKHNAFTNDNYEKTTISKLNVFRNLIGLTERNGSPVRYKAKLEIDEMTFDNTWIVDKASIFSGDRLFSTHDKDGKKIVVGKRDDLLKIKGASINMIKNVNLGKVSISSINDIRDLFIESDVLHTVAKIAYEWHCYINNIEDYKHDLFNDIVSYILSPNSMQSLVEIITEPHIWEIMDRFSRTGSNMLFEYEDLDGYTYVVFGFWGVILYKIRICKNINYIPNNVNSYNVYLYHVDGTMNSYFLGLIGNPHFESDFPKKAITILCDKIKSRLANLGERDLSKEYIAKGVRSIKKILPQYKNGTCSVVELLDYEDTDRVSTIFILELLYLYKDEYNFSESFNENMYRILKTDDRYELSENKRIEIIENYVSRDKDGTLISLIEDSISFFESINRN